MKFKYGTIVQYRHTKGWINFIDDDYITICFLDEPDKSKRIGRYQSNLVVYHECWDEVCCCVDETKEKENGETTSYFLQSRGCNLVGAAC